MHGEQSIITNTKKENLEVIFDKFKAGLHVTCIYVISGPYRD
jgi:hypothetical protein